MLQTFNVPAGGRQINAKASFFRLESVSASGSDESVRVRADGQDLGTYLPGDALRLPIDASNWEVTPVTGTATAIVRLGVGGVDSSRVFGVVSVVDTAKQTTLSGAAFTGLGSTAAVAAQYGTAILWNPAGSTRRLVLENLRIRNTNAGAQDFAVGGVAVDQFVSAGGFANKLVGSPGPSAALIRQKQDHGVDPVALLVSGTHAAGQIAAGASYEFAPKRPIVIPPGGFGFMVANRTVNSALSVYFDFYEESAA